MNPNVPEGQFRAPWWWYAAGGAVVLFLLIVIVVGPGENSTEVDPTDVGPTTATDQRQSECARSITNAFSGMQPERLGLSAKAESLAREVTYWSTACRPAGDDVTRDDDLRKRLLPPEHYQRTLGEEFLPRDVWHIRTSRLLRAVQSHATRDQRDDLDRVTALFWHVVRHVQIARESEAAAVYSPYEMLMLGRGAAADRAWLFVELVRQLRLDAVVLEPATAEEKSPAGSLLVGVILPGGGVALFDAGWGVPIPAAEASADSVLIDRPALLSEVRASDEPFKSLTTGTVRYPWTSADFAEVRVRIVGDSSRWSERMARLEQSRPADIDALLYDGLGASALRAEGLYDRIVAAGAAGGWNADQVTVWDYPEARLAAYEAAGGTAAEPLASLFHVLDRTPMRWKEGRDENDQPIPVENPPRTPVRVMRTSQLEGHYDPAMKGYMSLRVAAIQTSPIPEIDTLNRVAKDQVDYWVGLCQFDEKKYDIARNTLVQYLNERGNGVWGEPALFHVALSLAEQGKFADAAQLLGSASSPENPHWVILADRWRRTAKPGS